MLNNLGSTYLENKIAMWGPTNAGKDWLFKAFPQELLWYNRKYPDFRYELFYPDPDGGDNLQRVYPVPPQERDNRLGVVPSVHPEDYEFIFRRSIVKELDDESHRISAYSHYIKIQNDAGGNLIDFIDNRVQFEQTYIRVVTSPYVFIILDPIFSPKLAISTQPNQASEVINDPTLDDDVLERMLQDDQSSLQGHSPLAESGGLRKDQYHSLLRMLLDILADHPLPKRYLAVCMTKMDQESLSGEPWGLLQQVFGDQIYQLFNLNRTTFEIEVFASSAAGYRLYNHRNVPNIVNNQIADVNQWIPINVAAPFFWIFQQLELQNLTQRPGSIFRRSNVNKYIPYPRRIFHAR